MGEASAGDVKMGRIGMVDRSKHPPLGQKRRLVHCLAQPMRVDGGSQAVQPRQGLPRQLVDARYALDLPGFAIARHGHCARAIVVEILNEMHDVPLPSGLLGGVPA